MAIAGVLRRQVERIPADVIQVDEANISGHPEDASWAAEAINHVLDGVRTTRAVHICFGNYGGQSIQRGFWKDLLPFLNLLHVDHYLLEFARRGYEELPGLADLDPKIGIGLSVVDIKDNEVESADLIASRVENGCEVLGEQRIPYIHPDCGFWMLTRSVADRKMQALVAGRDLFYGRKKEEAA
jgi:5-methyltetrahydropteroyltriglutamate--homocysteine methyltransferase